MAHDAHRISCFGGFPVDGEEIKCRLFTTTARSMAELLIPHPAQKHEADLAGSAFRQDEERCYQCCSSEGGDLHVYLNESRHTSISVEWKKEREVDAEGLTRTQGNRERERRRRRWEPLIKYRYLTRFLGFILAIRLTPFDRKAGRILQLFI